MCSEITKVAMLTRDCANNNNKKIYVKGKERAKQYLKITQPIYVNNDKIHFYLVKING